MSERAESVARNAGSESLRRGVLTILVVGILLGVAFNQLGRSGRPQRGLPWIAEELDVPSLPVPVSAPAATQDLGGAAADDPLGGAVTAGDGVPVIPDLDRPFSVDLNTVKKLFDAGAAYFVDARETADYAEGHIPGAVNLPYDSAGTDPARVGSLDSGGKPFVVYCGGGTCEVSIQLANDLVYQHGRTKVLVYSGGFPEWTGRGFPVARGK